MTITPKTALPIYLDRTFPASMVSDIARMLEQSGVVDFGVSCDQLNGFFPRQLWKPEITPMAALMQDNDSFADAFILAALATAATERLGVLITHDAIRKGPAELVQTMLTVAGLTEAESILLLGAGEVKQTRPYGYDRSNGLDRLEDTLALWNRLLDCDGPFDFQGKTITFKDAYIGTTRPHRPKIWVLGAGRRLLSMGARHADGWFTAEPFAGHTPEEFADEVRSIRQLVEQAGRDPDKFDFGIGMSFVCHEDPSVIETVLQNPLIRHLAGVWGRFDQRKWAREGVTALFPPDWHYALRYVPTELSDAEVERVLNGVTPDMVRKSYFTGDPASIAHQCNEYVDAGATHIALYNLCDIIGSPEQMFDGVNRSLSICRMLKETASVSNPST